MAEMVYFEGYAVRANEDLGDGAIITEKALKNAGKQFEALKGKPITLNFDHSRIVGYVESASLDVTGVLVKGKVRKEMKKDGCPSMSGIWTKKLENKITDMRIDGISWIKRDGERLRRAERVAELMEKFLAGDGGGPEREKDLANVEKAIKDWRDLNN